MEFGNQSKSYLSRLLRGNLNSFKAIGYEAITVDGTVKALTIPSGAKYALMRIESDKTGVVARYLETTASTVSSTVGLGLVALDPLDITDAQNLNGFRITQAQAGTHTLYVQYYK